MAQVAASALDVPHSRIREIADIAMSMGDGVLRLYFGESNLPTPDFLKRAAAIRMVDHATDRRRCGLGLCQHGQRKHGRTPMECSQELGAWVASVDLRG